MLDVDSGVWEGFIVTIVCWFLFSFERFARFHHFRGSSKDVRGF